MKSVLISIRPEWCELIANGKKTIEVRKTVPTLEKPFKVYIYCTKSMTHLYESKDQTAKEVLGAYYTTQHNKTSLVPSGFLNGKVIGEFVCNNVSYISASIDADGDRHLQNTAFLERRMCLTDDELFKYLYKGKGKDNAGYAWHISNLVMYKGMPRELSEFRTPDWYRDCEKQCPDLERMRCPVKDSRKADKVCGWCRRGGKSITRPPQSWCYVEALKGE